MIDINKGIRKNEKIKYGALDLSGIVITEFQRNMESQGWQLLTNTDPRNDFNDLFKKREQPYTDEQIRANYQQALRELPGVEVLVTQEAFTTDGHKAENYRAVYIRGADKSAASREITKSRQAVK